jgi:hypothetical protein
VRLLEEFTVKIPMTPVATHLPHNLLARLTAMRTYARIDERPQPGKLI